LSRQFTAYLGDHLARDPQGAHPRSAREALKSTAPESYLGQMSALVESHGLELADDFLAQFSEKHVGADARGRLRAWVTDELIPVIGRASARWQQDHDDLQRQIKDVEDAVQVLTQELEQQRHAYPDTAGEKHSKVEEAERNLRSARAQLKRLYRDAEDERNEY